MMPEELTTYWWAAALAVAFAAPLFMVLLPAYAVQRFVRPPVRISHMQAAELVVIEASINHLNSRVDAVYDRLIEGIGEDQ